MFTKENNISAVFVIPIINNNIYLGKRNTKLHQNLYGPIGGKIDLLKNLEKQGLFINSPDELYKGKLSIYDKILIENKFEHTKEAAIREFCEEVFSDKNYPEDFSQNDFTQILNIGTIIDDKTVKGKKVFCTFYVIQINRYDFSLSERELSDFTEIANVKEKYMFPIGKLALYFFKFLIGPYRTYIDDYEILNHFSYLFEQIPEFKILNGNYETAMKSALYYRGAKIKGMDDIEALKYAGFEKYLKKLS